MIRVSTLVAVLLLLAGCPATPASPRGGPRPPDANDHRLAVMRDEPLAARDPDPAIAAIEPDHRIMISAKLYEEEGAQNPSEVARKQTSDAMTALRENKWVIYFAGCKPPGWTYTVYAYKIVDAVSYGAALEGSGSGRARVSLNLLAPHSTEPRADVFPDRPAALEPGKSCVEASSPPGAAVETGIPLMMGKTPPADPSGDRR